MPRHDVKLKINAEIPIGNVDEELRGRLQLSTGSVDWKSRHARKAVRLTWSHLADLLEEHGKPVG